MPYIKPECFTPEWISEQKNKFPKIDFILLEKTIYAFELLAQLSIHKLDFIFKGGTSLILLLPEIKRLSIDIDILTLEKPEILEQTFPSIIKNSPFLRWEEDTRNSRTDIPKKHYKFFFQSKNKFSYILLDVIYDNSKYLFPKIYQKEIISPFFIVENTQIVHIPTIDNIIGDKLTAFAPKTIGIPFNSNKSMQIIKQLFDIDALFNYISDLNEIAESYKRFYEKEIEYRKTKFSLSATLNDTINTCFLLSQLDFKGAIENEKTEELRYGIKQIKSHIINQHYSFSEAKLSAAKTALLAHIIKNKSYSNGKISL